MNNQTHQKLLKINQQFYTRNADSFSTTRQYSWQGFDHCWSELAIINFAPQTILDLGCGNGRFVNFLKQKLTAFDYLGVDNSSKLLAEARKDSERSTAQIKTQFLEKDITDPATFEGISGSFDLIVMFAVVHHIPGRNNRLEILKLALQKLNPGGILIFTTWNFLDEPTIANKIIPWSQLGIDSRELEQGDYLLDWNKDKSLPRYCHYFSAEEKTELISALPAKLLFSFDSDGRNNRLNSYYAVCSESGVS